MCYHTFQNAQIIYGLEGSTEPRMALKSFGNLRSLFLGLPSWGRDLLQWVSNARTLPRNQSMHGVSLVSRTYQEPIIQCRSSQKFQEGGPVREHLKLMIMFLRTK